MLHLSGNLLQHYKDKANNNLADSESFKSKGNIAANTAIFGKILKEINCEVNLILTRSWTCLLLILQVKQNLQ